MKSAISMYKVKCTIIGWHVYSSPWCLLTQSYSGERNMFRDSLKNIEKTANKCSAITICIKNTALGDSDYHNFTKTITTCVLCSDSSWLADQALIKDIFTVHSSITRNAKSVFDIAVSSTMRNYHLTLDTATILWVPLLQLVITNNTDTQNGSWKGSTVSWPSSPGPGRPRWCSTSCRAPSTSRPGLWWPPPPASGSLSQSSDYTWDSVCVYEALSEVPNPQSIHDFLPHYKSTKY